MPSDSRVKDLSAITYSKSFHAPGIFLFNIHMLIENTTMYDQINSFTLNYGITRSLGRHATLLPAPVEGWEC